MEKICVMCDNVFDDSSFVGLWIDKRRPIPNNMPYAELWCKARSFHEAILKLELLDFEKISMGYNLNSWYGGKEMTGADVLLWLGDRKDQGLHAPSKITIHTNNAIGQEEMNKILKERFQIEGLV